MPLRPDILRCAGCTYRELFDAVEDIIYIRDLQGVILDINEAGARFFGKSKAELIGTTFHADSVDEKAMSLMETNLSLLEKGKDRSTLELTNAAGEPVAFEVAATVIRDRAGKAVGAYGIMRVLKIAIGARRRPRAASPSPSDASLFAHKPDVEEDSGGGWTPDKVPSDVFPLTPPPKKPRR